MLAVGEKGSFGAAVVVDSGGVVAPSRDVLLAVEELVEVGRVVCVFGEPEVESVKDGGVDGGGGYGGFEGEREGGTGGDEGVAGHAAHGSLRDPLETPRSHAGEGCFAVPGRDA